MTSTLNQVRCAAQAGAISVAMLFLASCSFSHEFSVRPAAQAISIEFTAQATCSPVNGAFLVSAQCISEIIAIRPGNYEFSIEMRGQDLEARPQDFIHFELTQYDAEGKEIALKIPYLQESLDGSNLEGTLLEPVSGAALSGNDFQLLHLFHRHYPADTGWVSPEVSRVRIAVTYRGKGKLWVRHPKITFSKWNLSFGERNSCFELHRKAGSVRPQLAVLSQGPSSKQADWLRSSISNRIADVYLLELSPASFAGSEVSAETRHLVELLKSSRVDWGIAYNPYWESEQQSGAGSFQISSPAAIAGARERISWFLKNGASVVMLRTDDLVPAGESAFSYTLESELDRRRFHSLGAAHVYLAAELLGNLPLSVKSYFVPPWYNSFFVRGGKDSARSYLDEIGHGLNPRTGIIWTGPTVRSLTIDQHELSSYRNLIAGHALSLWDNTIYARRHKDFWLGRDQRHMLMSYLEPYSVLLPDRYLFQGRQGEDLLLVNGQLDEVSQLQIASARSYLEAGTRYCPEQQLRAILKERLGDAQGNQLISLDRRFWSECKGDSGLNTFCWNLRQALDEIFDAKEAD